MATEQEEVAGLDRVLTRLALTQEDRLGQVLHKLIPAVIGTLKSPWEKTRTKVLEILSHVNKRVKGAPEIALPTTELLDMFLDPDSAPMVRNFALVYTEMAFERAAAATKLQVAGKILVGVAGRPAQHASMCLRMAMAGLEGYSPPSGLSPHESDALVERTFPFLSSPADVDTFLAHTLKLLLYQPPMGEGRGLNTPLAVAQARAQASAATAASPAAYATGAAAGPVAAAAAAAAEPAGPPAGLSAQDLKLFEQKGAPAADLLARRKLGVLNLLAVAGVEPSKIITHCLVAACDPNDAVARRGDELLKRRCAVDTQKPAVDLEAPSLIQAWMELFHGTPEGAAVAAEAKVAPASLAVRARLLSLFCRSVAAASQGERTLQTIAACTDEKGSNMRLRQAGMEFTVWTLRHAPLEQLSSMGQSVVEGLMSQLHKPGATDSVSLLMRSFAYQALGQLAQRVPALFSASTDTARFFFSALSFEPAGVRASVQEAVGCLAEAYKGLQGQEAKALEQLLLDSIRSSQDTVRLCAVQWAVKLFPFNHPPARYISLLAAGDTKIEVKEESKKGLAAPSKGKAAGDASAAAAAAAAADAFPSLPTMLQYVLQQHSRFRSGADPLNKLLLQPAAFVALIRLLHSCQVDGCQLAPAVAELEPDCLGAPPPAYCHILEHALVPDTSSEVAVLALESLLDLAQEHPASMADRYSSRTAWLRGFLSHINPGVRTAAARMLGVAVSAMQPAEAQALLQEVSQSLGTGESVRATKVDEHEGCILATGYLLAQCLTGSPSLPPAELIAATAKLVKELGGKSSTASSFAALSLAHVALRGALPLGDAEQASSTRASTIARVVELFEDKEPKVVGRCVTAAALLATSMAEEAVLSPVLTGLFKLSFSKAEDVQFAVGEALSIVFGGVPITPDQLLKSNFQNLASHFDFKEQEIGDVVVPPPPAGQQYVAAGQEAPRVAAREQILDKILKEMVPHTRQEVRCAAAVWLFSLLVYTHRHPRLTSMLPEIQAAFSQLLGDTNELTQEMASRGVSAVYGLGDESMKQQLVANLVGVLSGSGKQAIKVSGDTKVFEAGQLGSAPGGESLSTYKELCSLATELGQPDLIYKFMDLAHHNASVNAKRGAAFGFASIAKLAGAQLGPHMERLVPKLYRYQYDPNPRVQDAMTHIWRALVDNPKTTVDENFDAIMEELLGEMGGRLWRGRQSSCAALADLMGGRRWAQLGKYLERIWSMLLRAMDDIKDSVRVAAANLARTVRGLTLRLVDVEHTPPSEVQAAVSVVVPLLLEQGVNSSVAEVRALAINLLAQVCKVAGAAQLQAQLVPLTTCMLEALSSLEDARLNYVEQHAERMGLDADKLADLRVSASKSSPIGDTLDLAVRYTQAETLEGLVPALVGVIKRGVGLNTKVGSARFIKSLAMRLSSSELQPHLPLLTRTLFNAARSERSNAIRRAHAGALAALAKMASPKRVEKLVTDCVGLYTDPGDSDAKLVSGLLLRELLKGAPDAFQAHAAAILPLAFAAKMDDESAEVAGVWREVWEEGVSSEAGAARLYMAELVAVVMAGLGSQQWGRKKSAAQAVVKLVELSEASIAPHAQQLAATLIPECAGRLWDGKEKMLEALAALASGCPAALVEVPGHGKVVDTFLAAAARQKSSFRVAALAGLKTALLGCRADFYEKVSPMLLEACRRHSAQPDPSTSTPPSSTPADPSNPSDPSSSDSNKPPPLPESLQVLQAAWTTAGSETIKAHAAELGGCLAEVLAANHPWSLRVEALKAVRGFTDRMQAGGEGLLEGLDATGSIVGALVTGTIAAAQSASVQQLRKTALATMGELLRVSKQGASLEPPVLKSVTQFLDHLSENESSAAIRADALELRAKMEVGGGGGGSSTAAVPMSS